MYLFKIGENTWSSELYSTQPKKHNKLSQAKVVYVSENVYSCMDSLINICMHIISCSKDVFEFNLDSPLSVGVNTCHV